jgi:hypothetical protein
MKSSACNTKRSNYLFLSVAKSANEGTNLAPVNALSRTAKMRRTL